MTDLSSFDSTAACEQGAEIELLHLVSRAPTGIFISVVGSDSVAFKNRSRAAANAQRRHEEALRSRGKKSTPRSVEEIEQENIALVAACVTGWKTVVGGKSKPVLVLNGKDIPFSPENVIDILTRFPKIFEQVSDGVTDLENFLPS